jgi:hypothetical protein
VLKGVSKSEGNLRGVPFKPVKRPQSLSLRRELTELENTQGPSFIEMFLIGIYTILVVAASVAYLLLHLQVKSRKSIPHSKSSPQFPSRQAATTQTCQHVK